MSSKPANAEADTKTKSQSRRRTPSFTFFLLLLTWIALGGLGGYFYHVSGGMPLSLLKNVAQSGNVSIDIAALTERVTTLEQQVEVLESVAYKPTTNFSPTTDNNPDEESISNDQQDSPRLSIEEPTASPAPISVAETDSTSSALISENIQLKTQLLEVQKALTALQQNEKQDAVLSQHAELLIAATDLQQAVISHRPYGQELSRFRQLTSGDARFFEAIDTLALMAEQGIPKAEKIEITFENAFERAITELRKNKENPTLFEKLTARFPTVILIRKTADSAAQNPAETDIEMLIAQAESQMLDGQYLQAINKIESINSEIVQAQFQDWLTLAKSHENAIEQTDMMVDLSRALVQQTSGGNL